MYFVIQLCGGLCNQLQAVAAAMTLAKSWKIPFLWPAHFRATFDLEYFNAIAHAYTGLKETAVADTKGTPRATVAFEQLWELSERGVRQSRKTNNISKEDERVHVLKALALNQALARRVPDTSDLSCVHLRIASDWPPHAEKIRHKLPEMEKTTIDLSARDIVGRLPPTWSKVFFTCGEHHHDVSRMLEEDSYDPSHFYDPKLSYFQNAAVNFEAAVRSKAFVGNTRSSFSNMVCLAKAVFRKTGKCYAYNWGSLTERHDLGA